jgi:hypothetical protein
MLPSSRSQAIVVCVCVYVCMCVYVGVCVCIIVCVMICKRMLSLHFNYIVLVGVVRRCRSAMRALA